jgi:hypothetical protein
MTTFRHRKRSGRKKRPKVRNRRQDRPAGPTFELCDTSGKRGYRSKADALVNAAVTARNDETPEQRAYRCPFCGRWHTTHQARNERAVASPAPIESPSQVSRKHPPTTYLMADETEALLASGFDWRSAVDTAIIRPSALSAFRRTWPNSVDARSEIQREAKAPESVLHPRLERGVIAGHEYTQPVLVTRLATIDVRFDRNRIMVIRKWRPRPMVRHQQPADNHS